MSTMTPAAGTRQVNGQVALADPAHAGDPRYTNGDLAPLPIERRTWNTYNYSALWVGMSHNIPSFLLASGLVALGMNWVQAVLTIAIGNVIVLVPCCSTATQAPSTAFRSRCSRARPSGCAAPTWRRCSG